MSQTVSFILPVRDFQYGVRSRVTSILEVLAELTDAFDILVVDYGSDDETRDVAIDLTREFPQVGFLELGANDGLYGAIEFGIFRTDGEIIFVHDANLPLGMSTLQNLWRMRNDEDLVMAQSRSDDLARTDLQTFSNAKEASQARTSIQMLRRCAIPEVPARRSQSAPVAVERVTRTDLLGDGDVRPLPKLLTRLRRFTQPNRAG